MNFDLFCLCTESFAPERQNELDWVANEDEQFQGYLTARRQLSTTLVDDQIEKTMFPNRPKYLSKVDDTKLYQIVPKYSVQKADQFDSDVKTPYASFDPFFYLPYTKNDLTDDETVHFYSQMFPRKCIVTTSVNHLIYCYGGNRSNILADMWCYNTENHLWHRVSGVFSSFHVRSEEIYFLHLNGRGYPTPLRELGYPRAQIGCTLLSTTDLGVHWKDAEVLLLGGWTGNLAVNELWSFHCRTRTWKKLHAGNGESLPSRYDHAARFIGGYMIVFGGFSHDFGLNHHTLGDTQIYDIKHNAWLPLDQNRLGTHRPPPCGGVVSCSHDNKFVLFSCFFL